MDILLIVGTVVITTLVVFMLVRRSGISASDFQQLLGRISQMSEDAQKLQGSLSEQLQRQERDMMKRLDERLADVSTRVGEGLNANIESTHKNLSDLKERLAVIDSAQKNITDLSTQMVSLQDILSNKQRRGAFGEIQLQDLVTDVLPTSAYEFQSSLSNGTRVDCLLKLPHPPGPIAVDAKFPLEHFEAMTRAQTPDETEVARRNFARSIMKHVDDIASKYIIAGETSDAAILFLPSESIYAELHGNFQDTVMKAFQRKVYIASPNTLFAILNTMRALLKDAEMRQHTHLIQTEVSKMLKEVGALDDTVSKLQRHLRLADDDLDTLRKSAGKLIRSGDRIEKVDFHDDTPAAVLPVPPVADISPLPRIVKKA